MTREQLVEKCKRLVDDYAHKFAVAVQLGQCRDSFDAETAAYAAIDELSASLPSQGVPAGHVLMPMRPNREMNRVMESEDWQWEDLLAAAGTVSEEDCALAASPAAPQGVQADELATALDAARDALPTVGEPESVTCCIDAPHLRTLLDAATPPSPPAVQPDPAVSPPVQALFAAANEIHGCLYRQTYDEHRVAGWDLPDEHEFMVSITVKQERDLRNAIFEMESSPAIASNAVSPDVQELVKALRLADLNSRDPADEPWRVVVRAALSKYGRKS